MKKFKKIIILFIISWLFVLLLFYIKHDDFVAFMLGSLYAIIFDEVDL